MAGGGVIAAAGQLTASSNGTLVTAAATAHVKGAWSQLVAATGAEASWIEVYIGSVATAVDYLIDIGIGAAASEQVIIPNLVAGSGTGAAGRSSRFLLPLNIPAGVRVAARCQATTISSTCRVSAQLGSGGWPLESGLQRVTDYGTTTATTQGTTVDPGAVANTKGSWVQLAASTTNPIRALLFGQSNLVQTARTSCQWLFDLGVGAAASEVVVIPNRTVECVSTEDTIHPQGSGPFPVNIPAGSRLAVRAQCSITTVTVRNLCPIVYGIG